MTNFNRKTSCGAGRPESPFKARRFPGQIPEPQEVDELRDDVAELIVPGQEIDGPVAGHRHEPSGGMQP